MNQTDISNAVQTLYVAIMGRAADAPGLAYWVDNIMRGVSTLDDTRASFIEQVEYTAKYSHLTTIELVTQLYNNLFERAPDIEGLNYWVNELERAGSPVTPDTVVAALIAAGLENGAQDAQVINNKVEVADLFTAQSAAKKVNEAFSALASEVVAAVDGSAGSVNQAKAAINSQVGALENQLLSVHAFEYNNFGAYSAGQLEADVGPYHDHAKAINLLAFANIKTYDWGSKGLSILLEKNVIQKGLQFYMVVEQQPEAYLQYKFRLDEAFDFTAGMKLPGLGNTPGFINPTAQRALGENDGFSARFMLKESAINSEFGELELYIYRPFKEEGPGVKIPLLQDGQPILIKKGETYTLDQHIVMNDIGQSNGTIEVWLNGQSVLHLSNEFFGNSADNGINRAFVDVWHGGRDASFAPTVDSEIIIDDIAVSTDPIVPAHFAHLANTTVSTAPIVGNWKYQSVDELFQELFFYGDGQYVSVVTHVANTALNAGDKDVRFIEYGTYDWLAQSGLINSTVREDHNGAAGLNGEVAQIEIIGSQLQLTQGSDATLFDLG